MEDFRKEFERVRSQVLMGNAHLQLWKKLSFRLGSDPQRLAANASPTFFGMTLESHLATAVLHAARIFDTHRDSLNLEGILKRAHAYKGQLPGESARVLEETFDLANREIPLLEETLKAVRTRRDKTLAHLDPEVVRDPTAVAEKSKLTVDELQKIFDVAWRLLNGVSVPYWDFSASHELLGIDDYETTLDFLENGKRRQREEYEAEFGPFPDPH